MFKGLLSQYQTDNNSELVSKPQLTELKNKAKEIEDLKKEIPTTVQQEIQKLKTIETNQARRFRYAERINSNVNPEWKPNSSVPFAYLRRMSEVYPVARACINWRIRQISQLEWDVTTVDKVDGEDGFKSQIDLIKAYFKNPIGHTSDFTEMLTTMVNDLLSIDAVCFEKRKTRGGDFLGLVPVDPTTIALRVTEYGGTPEPPENAYVQIINGQELGKFTTDEMIYKAMNKKSYSPYGVSPLESLIIQVESALRGDLYNLDYFRENNVPEGFLALPSDSAMTLEQVEEWQSWFDGILAGDRRMTHRLKILPAGAEYIPTKKPEDMAFEKFELWLAMITCAMFEVQPQDIGLTLQVNKASAEVQQNVGKEKGLIPTGNFLKGIFDEIIQKDLGFVNLQFQWVNINPIDRKEEVEVASKEIENGLLSPDEYREEHGREPLGMGAFIRNGNAIVMVEDIASGKYQERQDMALEAKHNPVAEDKEDKKEEPKKVEPKKKNLEIEELKRWRKAALNDIKLGREIRVKFPSEHINEEVHKQVSEALAKAHSRLQVKLLFDQFIDPELRASFSLLDYAEKKRKAQNDR